MARGFAPSEVAVIPLPSKGPHFSKGMGSLYVRYLYVSRMSPPLSLTALLYLLSPLRFDSPLSIPQSPWLY